jgi:hypothetical protein
VSSARSSNVAIHRLHRLAASTQACAYGLRSGVGVDAALGVGGRGPSNGGARRSLSCLSLDSEPRSCRTCGSINFRSDRTPASTTERGFFRVLGGKEGKSLGVQKIRLTLVLTCRL